MTTAACGGSEFSAAGSGGSAGSTSGGRSSGGSGSGAAGAGGQGAATGGLGGTGAAVAGCIAYHHAYCAWADRCDQYLYGGSLEACQSTAESNCSWYELPGIAITSADFTRCAESYDSVRCDATPTCELRPGTRE